MTYQLRSIRAAGHRSLVGPAFDASPDAEDPIGLTLAEINADPKLALLAQQVMAELKEEFAAPNAAMPAETSEEEKYRRRLEGWAEVLETLLEETLKELDVLNAARTDDGGLTFGEEGAVR